MAFLPRKTAASPPVTPVNADSLSGWLKGQDKATRNWVADSGYTAAAGSLLLVPNGKGGVARVLYGVGADDSLYTYADLPAKLPENPAGYYIDNTYDAERATQIALGWALGSYRFASYKSGKKKDFALLVWPDNADQGHVVATVEAMFLVRDMVNTPANDMGPAEIAVMAKELVKRFSAARINIIVGNDLLKKNYPAVYEVGKGSPRQPRFIDITWGNAKHPQVTLIGKGVAFDTGGLDIKPSSGMLLMKKDMGGSAHVLGLAHMIMSANLPLRLRVLIPAVENSTDGNSFRPGDIIKTRKGVSVEIGNTDAEGRLILADALAEACRDKPDLIIDFATLTGAARVALGPDLPAMFANDEKTAAALLESAVRVQDPLWRLPLWQPYRGMIDSKAADINNAGTGGFAGAITAALFLETFVDKNLPWVHIDTFAWNPSSKPGRPEGGEALGIRAAFDMIMRRYGSKKTAAKKPAKKRKS